MPAWSLASGNSLGHLFQCGKAWWEEGQDWVSYQRENKFLRSSHRRQKAGPTHQPCPPFTFVSAGLPQCGCFPRQGGLNPYHHGTEVPSPAKHPVGLGTWGSPPEPRLWPEERHGRWQLDTSPSLLTTALLPTLILPTPPCPTGAQTTAHWPGSVPPLIHLGPEKALDGPVRAGYKAAATTYKNSYGWLGEWEAGVIVILMG